MIRRSTTLLLFAVLFVSGVYAQKTAKISFLETTHNFGSFSEKLGSVSCVFSFVNTGAIDYNSCDGIVRVYSS